MISLLLNMLLLYAMARNRIPLTCFNNFMMDRWQYNVQIRREERDIIVAGVAQ